MRFGKFTLAAIAAACLTCAPVMARSLDSADFTEKIVQKAPVSTNAATADVPMTAPSDGMVVRFDPRMVQYAVLPSVPKSMTMVFDTTSFEYAATVDTPALARVGSLYHAPNTT